jgi:coenzyme PQQ precursor peptide PqqA
VAGWLHVEFKQYRETGMAWKTPKIVEVAVGMEINMYACAARK